MTPIPLFVEICAGTAAVSLRLERDGARPPVSRMGAKTGYADAILGALDLWPGQRAERYLWAEADPGVRLLLAAYTDRRLAQAAAEVIRGWAGEDPRALWERLRDAGAPAYDPPTVYEVTRFICFTARAMGSTVAWRNGRWCSERGDEGGRLSALAFTEYAKFKDGRPDGHRGGSYDYMAEMLLALPEVKADIVPDGWAVQPRKAVVYIDPTYEKTTQYAHNMSRKQAIDTARRWKEAGARVAYSEAEPIEDLLHEGWVSVEITDLRVGGKRTQSRQQREVLTLSEAPPRGWDQERRVGRTRSLFGGGR